MAGGLGGDRIPLPHLSCRPPHGALLAGCVCQCVLAWFVYNNYKGICEQILDFIYRLDSVDFNLYFVHLLNCHVSAVAAVPVIYAPCVPREAVSVSIALQSITHSMVITFAETHKGFAGLNNVYKKYQDGTRPLLQLSRIAIQGQQVMAR